MADPRTLANLVFARAEAQSAFLPFRGFVPGTPPKGYASFYFGGGINYADRLVGSANMLTWSFRAVCVGYDDDTCLYVLGKVRSLYLNWRPLTGLEWFTEAPDDPPLIVDDSVKNDVRSSITPRFTITTTRSL